MADTDIRVSTNADDLKKLFRSIAYDQMPFAQSLISNRLAQKVKSNELQVMARRIDRPTKFTMNSLQITAGNKQKPEARVWFKDQATKGTPADRYLGPIAFGGERSQKRSERALQARGYLAQGQYLVPAAGARLDAYGNMRKSQVIQVLSQLRAFAEQGHNANATDSARSRAKRETGVGDRYFWATINGETGVWERVKSGFGTGARPVLLRVDRSPRYKIRFPFFKIAENTIKANFEQISRDAIEFVIATAIDKSARGIRSR